MRCGVPEWNCRPNSPATKGLESVRGVLSRVLDDPRLILENGGRAQARIPVDLADLNPVVRLNQMRSWSTTPTNRYRYGEEPGSEGP